jgi:hypothetical protein
MKGDPGRTVRLVAKGEPMRGALLPLVVVLAILSGCSDPSQDAEPEVRYPVSAVDGGVTTYEFGPGSLETTDDEPWDGSAYLLYPPVWDTDAGAVTVEVLGLDLSGIQYGGDLGWPPDSTDTGALVQTLLTGSSDVAYRVFSTLAPFERSRALNHDEGWRAYQFSGFTDGEGPYGVHHLDLERWSPDASEPSYDTFDLRMRYADGLVEAWVRMHASRDWAEGETARGARCPSNVAINNAAPGTADSAWSGECTAAGSSVSGLAVGAWVPVESGAWRVIRRPGTARLMLFLGNWAFAEGPYRVTWANVIVRGPLDESFSHASGAGRLRVFGTGASEREPRGERASFRYLASVRGPERAALFHYEAPGFEVAADDAEFIDITAREVTLLGAARVNGRPGYSYEFTGTDAAGAEPDSLVLRVWGPVPSARPFFEGFGSIEEGGIEVVPAPGG